MKGGQYLNYSSTMKRICDYIDSHLKEEITLNDLSKISGYSSWHLYKIFNDYLGIPVMEYIRKKRLECVINKLTNSQRLYDIALDYGFETQAGFNKAFQKQLGCSPQTYRTHELRGENFTVDPVLIDLSKEEYEMEEKVLIRSVLDTDAEDMWENIWSRNTPNEVKERIAKNIKKINEGNLIQLVAEIDNHVIGTISLIQDEHPMRYHRWLIGDFVVNPLFQRQGIGKKLFKEIKKNAIDKNVSIVEVTTRGGTLAEKVYKKLGFIELGRIPAGLLEPWNDNKAFDEVMFYMPLET